jgi:hypothetical protein
VPAVLHRALLFFDDKQVMLAYLNSAHENTNTIVFQSIRHRFQQMSVRLRNDRDVLAIALAKNGLCLEHVPQPLKDSQAIVASTLQQDGKALQFASQDWQDDTAMVQLAVKNDALSLEFASSPLRGDGMSALELS